jgi:hypothetical protein
MKDIRSTETSETTYKTTRRRNLEDRNSFHSLRERRNFLPYCCLDFCELMKKTKRCLSHVALPTFRVATEPCWVIQADICEAALDVEVSVHVPLNEALRAKQFRTHNACKISSLQGN